MDAREEYKPSLNSLSGDETMSGELATFEPEQEDLSGETMLGPPKDRKLSGEPDSRQPRNKVYSGEPRNITLCNATARFQRLMAQALTSETKK